MQDRQADLYGRWRLDFDDPSLGAQLVTMTRADEATVEGTPLDSETFLKNATAILYGHLDPTGVTPDDILNDIHGMLSASGGDLTALQQAIADEAQARQARDTELGTAISDGLAGLQAQVTTASDGLAAEVLARQQGDANIQQQVTANAAAIAAEATAREQGDLDTVQLLTPQLQALAANIGTLTADLAGERQARRDADIAEAQLRQAADTFISQTLGDEITRAANAETQLGLRVTNVDNASQQRDTNLQGLISQNTGRITAEETARQAQDTFLQQLITTAQSDLQTSIGQVSQALAAEVTARQDAVSLESSARQGADIVDVTFDTNVLSSTMRLRRGDTTFLTRALPVAGAAQAGLMNAATWLQVQANTAAVSTFANGWYVGAYLGAAPTEADLEAAWLAASIMGGTEAPVGAVVINLDQDPPHGHEWMKVYDESGGTEWVDRNTSVTPLATNTSPGIVKGTAGSAATYGTISVNQDGTMTLNGYNEDLVSRITYLEQLDTEKAKKDTGIQIFGTNMTCVKTTLDPSSAPNDGQMRLIKLNLTISGVNSAPGSYGPSSNRSLTFGESFLVPRMTVDGRGWVTASANTTLTLPTPPVASATTNGYLSSTLWTKLNGIQEGAQANIQPDWAQADDTKADYIKNKPGLLTLSTATPSPLGTAAAGVGTSPSREDHVHPMPSAAAVGAEPAITSGAATQYWSGTKAWSDFGASVRGATLAGLQSPTTGLPVASDTVLQGIGKLGYQVGVRARNSVSEVVTVAASAWTGSAPPYTATVTLNATVPFTERNLVVGVAPERTTAQYMAALAAMIQAVSSTTTTLTLVAEGAKPTVNIPVSVVYCN